MHPNPVPSPRRGSVILTVLIFTSIIGLVAGSLLAYTISERRLNQRTQLRYESKNAAEAILEYGAAELSVRLRSDLNFSTAQLSTTPLTVFSSRRATLYSNTGLNHRSNVEPATGRIWVSQQSEVGRRLVDPTNPANDFDPLRGQNVSVQAIRLLAQCRATNSGGVAAMTYATQLFEVREAALFNYAIFYNVDMEFHPGPTMSIFGPVHSNRSLYTTSGNGLNFYNMVTTAGDFILGDKGVGRGIDYNIRVTNGVDENGDGLNDLVTLNNPTIEGAAVGSRVDSNLISRVSGKTFQSVASQAYRGFLQDRTHGITAQYPPGVLSPTEARKLIEPPSGAETPTIEQQKFANKAGLYVLVENDGSGSVITFQRSADAAAYKATAVALRPAWRAANPGKIVTPPAGMVNNQRRMFDHRENRWINTVDINVGAMRTAVNTTTSGAASNFKVAGADWDLDDAATGWNGIVYVDVENPLAGYSSTSDINGAGSGTRTAVRLLNGGQLPNRAAVNAAGAEGLSVATNGSIYVAGHFNADGTLAADLSDTQVPEADEVPAAIAADAINVLSQAWLDGSGRPVGDSINSTSGNGNPRTANHTEISAAFLTGIVESTAGGGGSAYSGGVENYPRFHENWSGRNLRYRGSMVALFASQVATGTWNSSRYSPPARQWGHNLMFAGGRYPPGTPRLRTFRRLDYRDLTQGEFNTLLATARLNFREM